MFLQRVQPWQLGLTEFEMVTLIKCLENEEDLTDAEERRLDKLAQRLRENYDKLRIKKRHHHHNSSDDDDYEDEDETERGDKRDKPSSYQVPEEAATGSTSKPAKRRRAVRGQYSH